MRLKMTWKNERPFYCGHHSCEFVIRIQDSICGGKLPEPEAHEDDFNTHRLCLRFDESEVVDLQVNKSDLYHFGRVLKALNISIATGQSPWPQAGVLKGE